MKIKKRKNNFFSNSRNLLIALLVTAAFLTVYAQVNGAIVSHTADQIEPGYLSVTTLNMLSGERPESPAKGDIYLDQNDNELYYYNGEMWMRLESIPSGTGTECSVAEDCESGFCVDGYCCDSACDTTCYSCNVPGLEGYCTELTDYAEDSGCSAACKGCVSGSCVNIPNTVKDVYGSNQCTDLHYRCDGSGSCTAPTTTTCKNKGVGGNYFCVRFYEDGVWYNGRCTDDGHDGCVGTYEGGATPYCQGYNYGCTTQISGAYDDCLCWDYVYD